MGYKFSPGLTGLTRGKPRPGAKHRADGRRICEEAGNERYSNSSKLDRTRSINNEYKGYCSGGQCWDEMEDMAAKYRVKGKTRNGREYEHNLRFDAVIGYEIVLKPPLAMIIGWTPDDYKKFYDDCFYVLEAIEPRLFRLENVRMTAVHRDEGWMDENCEHLHVIGAALDAEGHYCGNLLDAALLSRINRNFPRLMRERGWQLEDLDTTDFYRMGLDKDGKPRDAEYREERLAKWRAKRSPGRYIAEKVRETDEMYQDAAERLKSAKEALRAVEAKEQELAARELEMSRFIEAGRRALACEMSDSAADSIGQISRDGSPGSMCAGESGIDCGEGGEDGAQ